MPSGPTVTLRRKGMCTRPRMPAQGVQLQDCCRPLDAWLSLQTKLALLTCAGPCARGGAIAV